MLELIILWARGLADKGNAVSAAEGGSTEWPQSSDCAAIYKLCRTAQSIYGKPLGSSTERRSLSREMGAGKSTKLYLFAYNLMVLSNTDSKIKLSKFQKKLDSSVARQ
jgi:hypothetical protein